jgi:nitroreductase
MKLFESIFVRKSTRKYQLEKLSDSFLGNFLTYINNIEGICNSTLNFNLIDNTKAKEVLSGYVGNYGKIEAPHYLVIFGNNNREGLLECGYVGEEAVLYLTGMEIASCWIGANFKSDKIKDDFSSKKEVLALIAFGKATKNPLRKEDQFRRIPLNDLLIDSSIAKVNQKYHDVLKAIQYSPSAINSQPWRIRAGKEISLYKSKPSLFKRLVLNNLNYIDMGIAIKHLLVALDHKGYGYDISHDGDDCLGNEHIITIRTKE